MCNKLNLPELYKFYNCYDDGKVRYSRKYQVLVTNIIKFSEANKELIKAWNYNVNNYNWLFDTTDFFIETVSYETDIPLIQYFAKRKGTNLWFGLGELDFNGDPRGSMFCSGLLDVDGKLTKFLNENYEIRSKEKKPRSGTTLV